MTTYGVSPQGFIAKPVTQIVADIENYQLANVDPALDTSPDGPIGQLNGAFSNELAEAWEDLAVLANVVNRSAVEGALLDNVGSLAGCLRQTVKPSFVYCNCTLLEANAPYLAGTLICNDPAIPATHWTNAYDVPVTADGIISVLFLSVDDGPIEAEAGTLTQITAAVTGWSAVTNPLDAQPGQLEELDPDYRLRQEEELAGAGSCTIDAIRSTVLQVPGVVNCTVLENTTLLGPDANGLPPKSFEAIVYDGIIPAAENAEIGQAVWDSKPAGIQAYGTTSVQVVDSQQNSQTAYFTRPTQRNVYLAYTVTLTSTASLSVVAAAIKAAVSQLNSVPTQASYGGQSFGIDNGYQITPGTPVIALILRSMALNIPGVIDVPMMALDFTASPTNLYNLGVTPYQIAVLDSSRITVNGI